jgi:hypothetical protein
MRFATLLTMMAAGSLAAQRTDTIVRIASRPVHQGVAELARDLAIGVADGDDHYMIGGIDDIAVAPNGVMYVLDRSVPALRVYDAKGKFVKTIGRNGSGPGEFRSAAAIAVARNGNVLLWDPGNARINVYTAAGDVVTSWPTRGNTGSASGRGLLLSDTSGVTYVHTFLWRREGQRITRGGEGWIRFDSTGTLLDTVSAPAGGRGAELQAERNGGSSMMSVNVPFAASYFAQRSPLGYFVTGQASRLAVDLHEPGKPIASIRRDVPTQTVSARERDSARADVVRKMLEFDPGWSWNGPEIPKVKPAYSGLYVGADGSIWVETSKGPEIADDSSALGRGNMMMTQQRSGAGRGGGRGPSFSWSCPSDAWSVYDIYEPAGRYLGQVRIPEKIEPIVLRGDFVWAATCNQDDVPQIVRYRINWR